MGLLHSQINCLFFILLLDSLFKDILLSFVGSILLIYWFLRIRYLFLGVLSLYRFIYGFIILLCGQWKYFVASLNTFPRLLLVYSGLKQTILSLVKVLVLAEIVTMWRSFLRVINCIIFNCWEETLICDIFLGILVLFKGYGHAVCSFIFLFIFAPYLPSLIW